MLEKENFKIDSTNWKVEIMSWWLPFIKNQIKVKINPEGDIIEYISWIPEDMIWEQLFSFDAAIRETKKIKKELPSTDDIKNIINLWDAEWVRFFESLSWKEEFHTRSNFVDNANLKSTWMYMASDNTLRNVDNFDYVWLKDKEILCLRWDMFDIVDMESVIEGYSDCFCSVRCLK